LGDLGANGAGATSAIANAINNYGTAVGYAQKFISGSHKGMRAVRWDALSTAAIELEDLGTDENGITSVAAHGINMSGTIMGNADKYDNYIFKGMRAVRWDGGGGTDVTELGILNADSAGMTETIAHAINEDGIIVGYADQYDGDTLLGRRAVYWDDDGIAVDLNTLIDPDSGWVLLEAQGISNNGWISGVGMYDPDGVEGTDVAYERLFLLQVPEPATLSLLVVGGLALLRRKRK
jgi:probable HAF family extracellular repeat protein